MASHGEFASLMSAALMSVNRAFSDGDEKGYDHKWADLPPSKHLEHGLEHIRAVLDTPFVIDIDDINLDHAIWRLIAAKAVLLRKQMMTAGDLDS